MRPILVVRDPRDWIYALTNENINHKHSYKLIFFSLVLKCNVSLLNTTMTFKVKISF